MRKFWCAHLLEDSFVLVHGMNEARVELLEGSVDRGEDGERSSCFQLLSETGPLRHLEETRHFCRARVDTAPAAHLAPSAAPPRYCRPRRHGWPALRRPSSFWNGQNKPGRSVAASPAGVRGRRWRWTGVSDWQPAFIPSTEASGHRPARVDQNMPPIISREMSWHLFISKTVCKT